MSDDIFKLYQSIAKNNQNNFIQPDSSASNKGIFQNTTLNATSSSSTPVDSGSNRINSLFNYLNLSLNDPINKNQILVPNTSNSLNNSAINQNVGLNNSNRHTFNYFDNDLFKSTSNENFLLLKRKREKCSKGLRHFSMKVCEKVKQKGTTTYNQVADELVNEYCSYTSPGSTKDLLGSASSNLDLWNYDQKNVRRRVYDALNVLMAMNIISKEKKEIKWIGLPCNKKQECQELEIEKKEKEKRIKEKTDILKNLILEHLANKSLIERNQEKSINDEVTSADIEKNPTKIHLPFVLISTDSKTNIDCSISGDKKEYSIQFDNTFQINSHFDILKKLGLANRMDNENTINNNSFEDVSKKASSMLPKMFEPYIKQMLASNTFETVCVTTDLPDYNKIVKNETIKSKKTSHTKSFNKEAHGYENENLNEDDYEKLSSKYADSEGNDKIIIENDETGEVIISDDEIYFENDDNFEDDDEDEDEEEDGDSMADSMSQ